MEQTSPFAQALQSQRLVITAECLPPKGADATAVRKLAAALPKSINAVVVAENHEEIRACALACAALLKQEKVEPILPLVSRDRNRIALQSDVLGAASMGVTNVLCVSGDHQSLGVAPKAAAAFDVDPVQLLDALKALCAQGTLMDGNRVNPPPALFLCAVAHPSLRPMKLNVLQTKKKVGAGAQVIFTHPVWDIAGFSEWMGALRGAINGTHIIASVRPLTSVQQAEEMQKRHKSAGLPDALVDRMRKAGDPAKEGIAICAELAAKAKDVQGVKGIHILSGGREDSLGTILEQAGLTRA